MVRFNITLPDDVAQQLKHIRSKSRLIAETLRERFKDEKKKEMGKILAQAYKQSAQEDRKINKEWEQISLESWE